MSKVFRGKFMDEMKSLHDRGFLEFHGSAEKYRNPYEWKELLNKLYSVEWVPYIKKTFNGAMSVIQYLGKYTHRIAISNYRLISVQDNRVSYNVKDYKNEGHWKAISVTQEEFVRRFLMHVLPQGFVRIRHYGLLSTRTKREKMILCRNQIGCMKYISEMKEMNTEQMLKHLFNKDITKCASCGGHMMMVYSCRYPLRC